MVKPFESFVAQNEEEKGINLLYMAIPREEKIGSFVAQNGIVLQHKIIMQHKTMSYVAQNEGVMQHKMARPTTDRKETSIHLRVNSEMWEKIQEESEREGVSVSEYIRERIEGFVAQNFVAQNEFSLGGLYDETLEEMSKELGINIGTFVDYLNYMVGSGSLYKDKQGRLRIKELHDPEYISVDEAIDSMEVSEWKKKMYKENIIKGLNVDRFDDIGNGGGL